VIKLYGFPISNYHNKVKIALIEKAMVFTEVLIHPNKEAGTLALSPLGKVPYMETEHGAISESQVQMEYLEALQPQPALLPKEPFQAAKMRELITYLELHVELVARRVYGQAFFGRPASPELLEATKSELSRNIAAFSTMVKFGPYLSGDTFTMADCAGIVHLPLVSMATKACYGEDMLAALPVKDYAKRMAERASVQKVNADRKAYQEQLAANKAKG
jgi:glutathione S-transferase